MTETCYLGSGPWDVLVAAADLGFPVRGVPTLQGWAPTYDFPELSIKLHEIENILGRKGGGAAPP